MKYRLILGIGLLLAILSAWSAASPWSANAQATCPAPVLLGAQGAAATTSNLLVLNPATGAVTTTIGPTGVALTGLAQNPVDGRVYGATASLSTVAPRSLVRITGTGAAVVIGS